MPCMPLWRTQEPVFFVSPLSRASSSCEFSWSVVSAAQSIFPCTTAISSECHLSVPASESAVRSGLEVTRLAEERQTLQVDDWRMYLCVSTCLCVSVSMYAFMHVSPCVCVYSCACMYVYTIVRVKVNMRTSVHVYECMWVCVFVGLNIYRQVCLGARICAHACSLTSTFLCLEYLCQTPRATQRAFFVVHLCVCH